MKHAGMGGSNTGRPLKLINERVWRTYNGGKLIDQWIGSGKGEDSSFPELWVASTVKAKNAGRENVTEGYSRVVLENDETPNLEQIIATDPIFYLGNQHVEKYGTETAVLVKILDSCERLTIQVHPDREFALSEFGSKFGKTEAWYILDGRTVEGEKPYVLFGFKPGVDRVSWQRMFDDQDLAGMLNALHKVPAQAGDVFLIEGGVPHAVGSGCLLIEIQEPTDFTLRTERVTPNGMALPDEACHQGLGFDKLMDCFSYNDHTLQETLDRWKINPTLIDKNEFGVEFELIGSKQTGRFQMKRILVKDQWTTELQDQFAIAIVVSGSGMIAGMEIQQSDTLFLPASMGKAEWISSDTNGLEIILCMPPA